MIIVGIVLTLVFWPKKDNDDNSSGNSDEIVEEDKDENLEESPETSVEVYATSLTLNLPSTINLLNGTSANLLAGYVQVLPNEAYEKLKIEITPRYNSSAFGVEFSNSTLTAKEVGTYNMTFSVPKSASTNFSKTVLITVYEEEINAHVTQLQNTMTVEDSSNINDFFEIKGTNCSVQVDDKLNYVSNMLSAVKAGDSIIKLLFTENYVKYIYEFEIFVKKMPQYMFVLNNVTDNTIEIDMSSTSVFYINYEIENREEGDVSQNILISSSDETIAYVEEIINPLIKIKALIAGTTTLTLTCQADTSVQIEITIIVK